MPQPTLLPTPASSTELLAKDLNRSSLGDAFNAITLPPPALHEGSPEELARPSSTSTFTSDSSGGSSYALSQSYQQQQEEHSRPRRASTAATKPTEKEKKDRGARELPPPPTRSRKIIQVKIEETPKKATRTASSGARLVPKDPQPASNKGKGEPVVFAGTKRKAAGGQSSAAGRKIARKTAHSLIERRRRSKMNEEFATLKSLIPACQGQEMHKLAILQASIDYLRYLEDCIADLKEAADGKQEMEDYHLPMVDEQSSPSFSPILGTVAVTAQSASSPALEAQRSRSSTPTPIMPMQICFPPLSPPRGAQGAQGAAGSKHHERDRDEAKQRERSQASGPTWTPRKWIGDLGDQCRNTSATMSKPSNGGLNPEPTNVDRDQNEASAALLMLRQDLGSSAETVHQLCSGSPCTLQHDWTRQSPGRSSSSSSSKHQYRGNGMRVLDLLT